MEEEEKKFFENEDGTFMIKTKEGDFVIEEKTDEIVEKCFNLNEKTGKNPVKLLAVRSIKSPEMTDESFGNLKGSTSFLIQQAVIKIYGLKDFL